MGEIVDEISRVHREVGTRRVESEEAGTVLLRRTFDAGPADVWDAVTSPERIARWFLPVTGEFRVGGHYQLEGTPAARSWSACPGSGCACPGCSAPTPASARSRCAWRRRRGR